MISQRLAVERSLDAWSCAILHEISVFENWNSCAVTSLGLPSPARLSRSRSGQVVLRLKSPYADGTTHVVMSPLEFIQRRAALVPRPRLHLIRFHGVLAHKSEKPRLELRVVMAIVATVGSRKRCRTCSFREAGRKNTP